MEYEQSGRDSKSFSVFYLLVMAMLCSENCAQAKVGAGLRLGAHAMGAVGSSACTEPHRGLSCPSGCGLPARNFRKRIGGTNRYGGKSGAIAVVHEHGPEK